MINSLNKYGDTSVRLKNQIKFYFNILTFINEKNITTSEEIYEWLKFENVINYNDNSSKINRSKFITKELKYFELIEEQNQKIVLSEFGLEIIEYYNKNNYLFLNKGIELISLIFFYIFLKKDKKRQKLFKSFIEFIYEFENTKYVDKKYFYDFVCSDVFEYKENSYNNYLKEQSNIVNEEDIKKCFYSDAKFNKLFGQRKEIKELRILEQYILKKEYLIKILSNSNSVKKCCKEFFKKKKITESDIENYFNQREYLIALDIFIVKKEQTVTKDYNDINLRWFKEMNIFYEKNNLIFINRDYKKIYEFILNSNLTFLETMNNIIKQFNIKMEQLFPYTKEQITEMWRLVLDNEWTSLKSKFDLLDIPNYVIFEYLGNISFYILEKDVNKFKNNCNTKLDINLKPISHATGGISDGIYSENFNNLDCKAVIESSLLTDLEQLLKNENFSTQRHAFNLYSEFIEGNKNPIRILIFKNIDDNIVRNFATECASTYFKDHKVIIKTIILDPSDIINLLEFNKINSLFNLFYEVLPIENKEVSLGLFYKKIINKLKY